MSLRNCLDGVLYIRTDNQEENGLLSFHSYLLKIYYEFFPQERIPHPPICGKICTAYAPLVAMAKETIIQEHSPLIENRSQGCRRKGTESGLLVSRQFLIYAH